MSISSISSFRQEVTGHVYNLIQSLLASGIISFPFIHQEWGYVEAVAFLCLHFMKVVQGRPWWYSS